MTPTPVILPPTARLPPIKNINNVPLELLHEAIQYLQIVYNPEIHTSRRIITTTTTTTHHGSDSASRTTPTGARPIREAGSANDEAVMEPQPKSESIRVDAFEHAYVVRWLTTLIAQKTTLHDDDDDDDNDSAPDLESLVQSAAALLAICAGAASAGTRTRTYVLGGGVRVQLTDVALRNDDFGSVGAQTWGSACVLAEMIAEAPARFGLRVGCDGNCNDDASSSLLCHGGGGEAAAIRVLELGAGTGLVSLTIGKILESSRGCTERERDNYSRRAEIVASDFYPPALENLRLNIQRNFPSDYNHGSDSASGVNDLSISAHLLNWEEEAASAVADPTRAPGAPFDVPFDEVFGADIVYELEHATWINACLERFLRLAGRFHLVIPLREGFARESATVERVFPRAEDVHPVTETGATLCITQKERITCEAWPDGKGEVEYVHYTIQWAVCGDRGDDSVHEYSEPSDI